MANADVVAYYDYMSPFYKFFWHKETNGIHYGLWKDDTKDIFGAILQMNETLADISNIVQDTKVLDAGCGVGGSSIWLAKHRGAQVSGITISSKQKTQAEENARRSGVSNRTKFYLQDYLHTSFPDNSFDVVWGLESICYATNKKDFLREAYRVIRPGGKIIVADGFLKRQPQNKAEEDVYRTFLKGFVLENLALTSGFKNAMQEVGFRNINYTDVNDQIQKTSQIMDRNVRRWYAIVRIARTLRLVPQLMIDHAETCLVQKDFFKTCGTYAIFHGEK